MARIRTIKPEFPQSESVGKLSREARLLFLMLFTIVDDAGRARAASRLLASVLYPYDDDAGKKIEAWLSELAKQDHIRRYTVDGAQYLEIIKWGEHQKIDRPSESKLPAYREGSSEAREDSRGLDADLVSSKGSVSGEEGSPPAKAEKKTKKAKVSIPEGFKFSETVKSYGRTLGFKDSDVVWQETRFIRHAKENSRECIDWEMAAHNWLDKALEFSGKSPPAPKADPVDDGMVEVTDDEQLVAWDNYARSRGAKSFPRNSRGGWRFPSQWPPGYVAPDRLERQPDVPLMRSMN